MNGEIDNLNSDKVIFIRHNENVEEIILNKPQKLNVIDLDMSELIRKRLENYLDYENNKNLNIPKIVILRGEGEKAFCAGGDITALYYQMKNRELDKIFEFYNHEIISCKYFVEMKPLQIVIWNGFAMGGGLGVSANAKIRIATDNTVFSMPEVHIGLYPDVGAAYFLTRMFNNIPEIGLFCGLTGYRIEGIECVNSGAATHFVKKDNLNILKETLINHNFDDLTDEDLLENISKLISPFCKQIYSSHQFSFPHQELIKQVFIIDSLLNIFDRLEYIVNNENDEITIKWAKHTLHKLNSVSPLSLHIFFNFAKLSLKHNSIEETYELDAKIFMNICSNDDVNDFKEGIRALLVDKDKKPQWLFKSVRDIQNSDEIFTKLFY